MADWTLHYPAWLIADGEPDFKVGDVFDWFAVEFWSEKPLTKTSETERSATQADDYRIRVSGELVFLSKKAVVIDFGLMAIGNVDKLSPGVGLGDFALGEIRIGFPLCIDPIPHDVILKLGRQWRMNSISADLTPYGLDGRRDVARITYREVTSTAQLNAIDYLLHCTELGPSTVPYLSSR